MWYVFQWGYLHSSNNECTWKLSSQLMVGGVLCIGQNVATKAHFASFDPPIHGERCKSVHLTLHHKTHISSPILCTAVVKKLSVPLVLLWNVWWGAPISLLSLVVICLNGLEHSTSVISHNLWVYCNMKHSWCGGLNISFLYKNVKTRDLSTVMW